MNRSTLALLLLSAAQLPLPLMADIGTTTAVVPSANSQQGEDALRLVTIGDNIVMNQRFQTDDNGTVQIRFVDGTAFTIGPRSDLVIDRFVYDPDKGTAEVAATTTRGFLRFVGGASSKEGGDATITTPVGVAGIRGAIAEMSFPEDSNEAYFALLYGRALDLRLRNGTVLSLTEQGTGMTLQSDESGPSLIGYSFDNGSGLIIPNRPADEAFAALTRETAEQFLAAEQSGPDDVDSPALTTGETDFSNDPSGLGMLTNVDLAEASFDKLSQTLPTNPTVPTDPTQPTEPTDPTGPTEPTNPTDGPGPTDPTEPTNPTDGPEPTDPTDPTEPTWPTDPTDPTGPVEPSLTLNGTYSGYTSAVDPYYVAPGVGTVTLTFDAAAGSLQGELSLSHWGDSAFVINEPNGYISNTEYGTTNGGTLTPGDPTQLCDCEFMQWGHWSADANPSAGFNNVAWSGYWVTGETTPVDEMPTSLRASYAGTAIGTVTQNNSTSLASGDFSAQVDFGTGSGSAQITDFGGRDLVSENLTINGSEFSGTLQATSSPAEGLMEGNFVTDGTNPVAGMIGHFGTTAADGWFGEGIIAGEHLGPFR